MHRERKEWLQNEGSVAIHAAQVKRPRLPLEAAVAAAAEVRGKRLKGKTCQESVAT